MKAISQQEKPICHKKELEEIISLFRNSIESELKHAPDVKIDIDKIIQEFENNLLENIQVLPNVEEKQADKTAKNTMKSLQAEAIQIKRDLHIYHTNFIENVRSNIEQDLNSKLPHIEKFDEEEDYMNNPDLQSSLQLIDKNIKELEEKTLDTKTAMVNCLKKYTDFANSVSSSLNNA